MFTAEFRDHVRDRVLELATADPRVTAGALIGSTALGAGDQWSDIDVAFGIADGNRLETVIDEWTEVLDQILALACLRLGQDARYGRGWSRLPASTTDPLIEALVRSLDATELRRALAVGTTCLIGELEQWDKQLCTRLAPLLQEFGAPVEREEALGPYSASK